MTSFDGGCGCTACVAARGTPGAGGNRPGLSRIAVRSGAYGDFLGAMLEGLSRKDRPALAGTTDEQGRTIGGLRTRDPDDPAVALLDAFAVTCDVLTFYTERLANEAYLPTAVERTSLQELGALVAYRLGRGAAAETILAFSLERPPTVSLPGTPDPGVLPPAVPLGVTLPVGLRVQSVPGPGELPTTFETVEEIDARPDWNALPVTRTTAHLPAGGHQDARFEGVALNLSPGDAIVIAGNDPVDTGRWDIRLLTAVEVEIPAARTHVVWDGGLEASVPPDQPAVDVEASVFRVRCAVFGHNAPVWKAMDEGFRTGYVAQPDVGGDKDADEWPKFTAVRADDDTFTVDLDGSHPGIVKGSLVALSQDTGTPRRVLYRVAARAELSRSAFAVSGKVTRLTLEGGSHDWGSPRDVVVYAGPDPLVIVEAPDDSPVTGSIFVVDGDATGMARGRTILLAGTTTAGLPAAEALVVDDVAAVAGGRTAITVEPAPVATYRRETAVVYANAARATHGETVTQVLGSGDARIPFTAFGLQRMPLTFVPADDPRGTASTLEVRVDDVPWREVPTTAIAGTTDRVFQTRDEPDGGLSVVFGDGERGARPATGSNNVRATYRHGVGAGGNVRRDTLSQPLDRPLGLKGVTNPEPATGGVDPEPESHARQAIPIPVRTLGRAVSLRDYADFALAYSGIGKAESVVLPMPGGPAIVVSVADDAGAAPPVSTLDRLAGELRRQGDPLARVFVRPCRPTLFRIALKVKVDPDRERDPVFAAVEAALRGRYGPVARDLGGGVPRSQVVAVAASVVGVVAVDLDRLYSGSTPGLASRIVARPAEISGALTLGTELVALSPDPFDWLLEMP